MANSPNHLLTSLTTGDFDLLKLKGCECQNRTTSA
jgi:hypothetical protein